MAIRKIWGAITRGANRIADTVLAAGGSVIEAARAIKERMGSGFRIDFATRIAEDRLANNPPEPEQAPRPAIDVGATNRAEYHYGQILGNRYIGEITWLDPQTGDSSSFRFNIESTPPLTREEIMSEAVDRAVEAAQTASPTDEGIESVELEEIDLNVIFHFFR